jgi:hypothetical protein
MTALPRKTRVAEISYFLLRTLTTQNQCAEAKLMGLPSRGCHQNFTAPQEAIKSGMIAMISRGLFSHHL